jgi:hypothetical protein
MATGGRSKMHGRKRQADEHARKVMPVIHALRAEGTTGLNALARALQERGVVTQLCGTWNASRVRALLQRAADLDDEEVVDHGLSF